jgi:pre-mRNA cleavage complex 2 protein Pcf11
MTSTVKMSNVAQQVAEEYASSLSDLTVNSKRLINMLTMLADENILHAPMIVQTVEKHLQKVSFKVLLDIVAA